MKTFFICFLTILFTVSAFTLSAEGEFMIDPATWNDTAVGATGLTIKLPADFEPKDTEATEGAEILLSLGDDDLVLHAIRFGAAEDIADAFDSYCLWDADSAWETTINEIPAVGFISSENDVYGVMLTDASGKAVELDFIISEDEERSARALNKASMMLETLKKD